MGGLRRHELEPEGADPPPPGHLDRVELAARDPQRRVRSLPRLGDDVAQREVEVLAVVLPAFLPEHRHQAAHRVLPHRPLVAEATVERVQLGDAAALAHAELDPAVADQVERADPLGDACRVVRRQLDDAVAEPDALVCAGSPPRGTPPVPTSGCTPRGSGARPPTRSRSRGGRRARSGRAPGSRARTRRRRSTAAAAAARRRCRTSWNRCSRGAALTPRAAARPGSSTARRGGARRRTRCGGPGTRARSSAPGGRRCRS